MHYAETSEQRFECKPLMEAMAQCVRDNRAEYGSYAKQVRRRAALDKRRRQCLRS